MFINYGFHLASMTPVKFFPKLYSPLYISILPIHGVMDLV